MKGIRQRWLLNSVGILVMILAVVVVAFSLVTRNYYDSNRYTYRESKARVAANYFSSNVSGDTSGEDYLATAQDYVSSFEDGTRLELQFLDPGGTVIYSSNGLTLSGTMRARRTSPRSRRPGTSPPGRGSSPRPGSGSPPSPPPCCTTGSWWASSATPPPCAWWTGRWWSSPWWR